MTEPEQWARELLDAVFDASDLGSACGIVDCPQCANAALTLQRAFEERERELREQNNSLRHWAWGHIDALLLYAAGQYPKDSHVKDAVAFCRALYPKKKLRMDPLEAAAFHPATQALATRQPTPTEGSSDEEQ